MGPTRRFIAISSGIILFLCIILPSGLKLTEFHSPGLNFTSLLNARPTIAVDIPTVTTIHPDRSIVWPGETLELAVHVIMEDRQGVEIGLVTISDLNNSWSQDYTLQSNSNGKFIVYVDIVTVAIEGRHVFQAVYQGYAPAGYQASSGMAIVEFLDAQPSGAETCDVIIQLDTGIVFTNESFAITVNITATGHQPLPFYGGNLAIAALGEGIVLTSYIIPSGFYIELSVTLDVQIPLWFYPGMTDLSANFTDTKDNFFSASEQFMIDILDVGHQLALSINPNPINRVDDTVTLRVDFAGDNATGKIIKVGWTDEVTNWTITTRTVTNDPEFIPWSISYSFIPGSYRAWVELRNPSAQYLYASAERNVILFDYVDLEWTLNSSNLAPGDTVSYHFECQQQDVVLAVPSRILIADSEEGLIGNVTTDVLGVVDFVWHIPATTPGGTHPQNVTVIPLDSSAGIAQQTFWISLTLIGRTQLQLTYPSQIQRGNTLTVAYQLSVENQDPVPEGQIYFNPPTDSLQIQDVETDGNGIFSLNISLDHPLGLQSFVVTYSGTPSYSLAEKTANITILAEPHFGTLYVNATPVLPGQTLRIFGHLLDEIDQGVPHQLILFYLSGSINIGVATTQMDGSFAYSWVIPTDATPGLNIISVEYSGNASAGYLSPMNQPKTTLVLISNDIALETPTIAVAGTTEMLKIHGGWGTEVSIFWQGNWSAQEHLVIANLSLPTSTLPYEVIWDVPLDRGEVTFRIEDSFGRTRFAITGVYVDPQYIFPNPLTSIVLYVDEIFRLNSSCSESYRILADGVPVTTWQTSNASLLLSFALRGLHTITMEITGSYVLAKTIDVNVFVYEPIAITLLVPSNATADSSVTIDINVSSGLLGGQPLSGRDISILLYDMTRCSTVAVYFTSLDNDGRRAIETDPLIRGTYEVQVQLLAGQDWLDPALESRIFYIVGQATLEFSPPNSIIYNESVVLSATLYDDGGPISEKTIAFWYMRGENQGTLFGENTTAPNGEAIFAWKPTLQLGNDYRLKAEVVNALDISSAAVIKPITVLALPPTILSAHSLLPSQSDTAMIASGEYEVVVQVQENSPFDYAIYLAVNGIRTKMTRVNSTEYLFQGSNGSYWISSNGNILYVGMAPLVGKGVYNIIFEAEDTFGTKNTMELGSFAIVPPTVLDIWSFLPVSNETPIALKQEYSIVAQVKENSPMSYSVYLVVNGQRTAMICSQGEGYTIQAPNGTKYFIPANANPLYIGMLSFHTNGTYKIEIHIEDEFDTSEIWEIGVFQVTSSSNFAETDASSGDEGVDGRDDDASSSNPVDEESVALVLIIGISSGAVAFVGRPRRNKI